MSEPSNTLIIATIVLLGVLWGVGVYFVNKRKINKNG